MASVEPSFAVMQTLALLGRYILCTDEVVAAAGTVLLYQLITVAAPHLDDDGWNVVVGAIMTICGDDPLDSILAEGIFPISGAGCSLHCTTFHCTPHTCFCA